MSVNTGPCTCSVCHFHKISWIGKLVANGNSIQANVETRQSPKHSLNLAGSVQLIIRSDCKILLTAKKGFQTGGQSWKHDAIPCHAQISHCHSVKDGNQLMIDGSHIAVIVTWAAIYISTHSYLLPQTHTFFNQTFGDSVIRTAQFSSHLWKLIYCCDWNACENSREELKQHMSALSLLLLDRLLSNICFAIAQLHVKRHTTHIRTTRYWITYGWSNHNQHSVQPCLHYKIVFLAIYLTDPERHMLKQSSHMKEKAIKDN